MSRLLAVVLACAACLAPAARAAVCPGDQNARVCVDPNAITVDPDGGQPVGNCFYLASEQCTPIFVTAPSAGTTGQPVYVCRPTC